MGYLDNSSVIVDAILTKKGRELLAKGNNQFNITKFALADDEIDYSLYNPAHPLGTDYYGIAIENLPMLEASPYDTRWSNNIKRATRYQYPSTTCYLYTRWYFPT